MLVACFSRCRSEKYLAIVNTFCCVLGCGLTACSTLVAEVEPCEIHCNYRHQVSKFTIFDFITFCVSINGAPLLYLASFEASIAIWPNIRPL